MNISFLIQARTGSTRLPGKIFEQIYNGLSLIELVYKRVLLSKYATPDNVCILTSISKNDDRLIQLTDKLDIKSFRGDEENVYKRFAAYLKGLENKPDYFLRICADNPVIEPEFIDKMLDQLSVENNLFDYCSYITSDGIPAIQTKYGFFCELINTSVFLKTSELGLNQYEQEHVTPLFYQSGIFRTCYLSMPEEIENVKINLSIDTKDDLLNCRQVLKRVQSINFSYKEILNVI